MKIRLFGEKDVRWTLRLYECSVKTHFGGNPLWWKPTSVKTRFGENPPHRKNIFGNNLNNAIAYSYLTGVFGWYNLWLFQQRIETDAWGNSGFLENVKKRSSLLSFCRNVTWVCCTTTRQATTGAASSRIWIGSRTKSISFFTELRSQRQKTFISSSLKIWTNKLEFLSLASLAWNFVLKACHSKACPLALTAKIRLSLPVTNNLAKVMIQESSIRLISCLNNLKFLFLHPCMI